ncbi:hypothetical protein [Nostoc sp.]
MSKTQRSLFICRAVSFSMFFLPNRPKEPLPVAIWETEIYQI